MYQLLTLLCVCGFMMYQILFEQLVLLIVSERQYQFKQNISKAMWDRNVICTL